MNHSYFNHLPARKHLSSFWLLVIFQNLVLVCWDFAAACKLSQVEVSGGYSFCSMRASPCGGFSCFGAWALGCMGSVVQVHRLSCPVTCGILVPGPEIKSISPALAGRFLTTGSPGKSHSEIFNFDNI